MAYLFRRNGIYYFRLVIPPDQRLNFGGKREIRKSLCTYNRQIALTTGANLLYMAKREISQKDIDAMQAIIRAEEEALENTLDPKIRLITYKTRDGEEITIDTGDDAKDAEILQRLRNTTPTHQPKEETILLSEAIAKFSREKELDRSWGTKTTEENRMIYGVMIEIVGDIPVSKMNYDLARYYKETLMGLPPNHKKVARYAGLSIDQILATKPAKTLAQYTINKHLSKASMLCDWCLRHGLVEANYFNGMRLKNDKRRADEEREAFDDDDLKKIFAPREKYLHPYYYWIPYLCLYTAARVNEMCQLYQSDVYEKDGVWVFDINENTGDKRLKTAASRRLVPIHSKLIELGFLDFVRSIKTKRIFDELPLRRDGYGQDASRWFGRWRKKIGVDKPFHCFRHTAGNSLKQQMVDRYLIKAIMGHSDDSDTTGRYGKQYNVGVLKETIEKLKFDI